MNNLKRFAALMLTVLMTAMFAACAGSPSSSAGVSQPPASVAPSSSIPEPEPEPLNQAFLTGLSKDASYPEGKRITAVMINNVPSARPQNGISEAKILVEIKVEYNVTRFMAIFEDYEKIPRTGGLRSARDQFFQLLIPYWGFYVHEGPFGSHPVNWLMDDYDYQEFDVTANYYKTYNVDSSRGTESYNWYDTDGELITDHIQNRGLDDYRNYTSPIFHFVSYNEPARVPAEGAVNTVEVGHAPPYYVSYFDYDAASHRYAMSMHNSYNGRREDTIDNNSGQQLEFDNVIVLFAPFSTYADTEESLPKVDYTQGGAGYYFSQGGYELIFWRKGSANMPLQLYKPDATETLLEVNTGTTYLAVLDDNLLPDFHDALTSGKMGSGGGGVDPDPVEVD